MNLYKKIPKPIFKILKEFSKIFFENGYKCHLVGGSVRDLILGKTPEDYDWTTDAEPEEIKQLFKNQYTVIETGIKHGTVTIIFNSLSFEVTTYRIDNQYKNNRHPESVSFIKDLTLDLNRRDFTINSITLDIREKKLGKAIFDPNGGVDDLKKGIIIAIGDPLERFEEDALRIIRAARFAAQLDFEIDDNTFSAMKEKSYLVKNLTAERIKNEVYKIFSKSKKPSIFFNILNDTNVLEIILPELSRCINFEQNSYHDFDLYTHSVKCCDFCYEEIFNKKNGSPEKIKNLPAVRFAGLLHDLGKYDALKIADDKRTFYNHETISENIAERVCKRFKLSNYDTKIILLLIKKHMTLYDENWKDSSVKKLIIELEDYIEEFFILKQADFKAKSIENGNVIQNYNEFRERIKKIIEKDEALSIKDLKIDGTILMNNGIKAGPRIGYILNQLLETVLDDPKQNETNNLLKIAINIDKNFN